MKKTTKKNARLRTIDSAQLAQVGGGAPALVELRYAAGEGSLWYTFYDAAFTAAGGCNTFACW